MAIEKKKCAQCHKEFHGTKRAEYCGSSCRAKAFRAKLKKAEDENKRFDKQA